MISLRGFLFLVMAIGFTLLTLEFVDGASTQVILGWILATVAAYLLAVVEVRGLVG